MNKMRCDHKDCKKKAIGRLSPDLDIKGLCYCEDHEMLIKFEYWKIVGNKSV